MKPTAIALAALLLSTACGASDEEAVEAAIRENLSQRGTVLNVEITPQPNGTMTGFAILRNHAGTEVRMDCTVQREGDSNMLKTGHTWRCQPAGPQAGGDRGSGGDGT